MTTPAFIFSRKKALLFLSHNPGTPGICKQCGCTHYNPCLSAAGVVSVPDSKRAAPQFQACGWADHTRTLCYNTICLAQAAEASTHAAVQLPQESDPRPQTIPASEG